MTDKPTEDRLHPILTNAQFREAQAAARKKIDKLRVEAAMKQVEETEVERLRQEEGMVTGGVGDEPVNITIDLAEFAPCLVINHRPYWHGMTYQVPRHVAQSLNEMMYRGWDHDRETSGTSKKKFYDAKRQAKIWAQKKGGVVIEADGTQSRVN